MFKKIFNSLIVSGIALLSITLFQRFDWETYQEEKNKYIIYHEIEELFTTLYNPSIFSDYDEVSEVITNDLQNIIIKLDTLIQYLDITYDETNRRMFLADYNSFNPSLSITEISSIFTRAKIFYINYRQELTDIIKNKIELNDLTLYEFKELINLLHPKIVSSIKNIYNFAFESSSSEEAPNFLGYIFLFTDDAYAIDSIDRLKSVQSFDNLTLETSTNLEIKYGYLALTSLNEDFSRSKKISDFYNDYNSIKSKFNKYSKEILGYNVFSIIGNIPLPLTILNYFYLFIISTLSIFYLFLFKKICFKDYFSFMIKKNKNIEYQFSFLGIITLTTPIVVAILNNYFSLFNTVTIKYNSEIIFLSKTAHIENMKYYKLLHSHIDLIMVVFILLTYLVILIRIRNHKELILS